MKQPPPLIEEFVLQIVLATRNPHPDLRSSIIVVLNGGITSLDPIFFPWVLKQILKSLSETAQITSAVIFNPWRFETEKEIYRLNKNGNKIVVNLY